MGREANHSPQFLPRLRMRSICNVPYWRDVYEQLSISYCRSLHMGWKTGVYCQQEHNQHDDTGSGAHPASDVHLQCSPYSVVSRQVYELTPKHGTGVYFFAIWKQYAASDRAGPASRTLSVVLNFRPSRCEPLEAHPRILQNC